MYRRILVAYDDSPAARIALEQALDLARAEHVESLTLLTVFPTVSPSVAMGGLDPAAEVAELRQRAEERLAVVRDGLPDWVPLRTLVREGATGQQIVAAAREGNHDLVVMGSRGRGPIGAALLGSTSTHVLHHLDGAVLVAHAPRDAAATEEPSELAVATS